MFTKLNKPIQIPVYEIQQRVVGYANKIIYSTVSTPLNNIFSLVPERYKKDFVVLIMEISGSISPHTDSGILSTINIYLKPDECKTVFYELIDTTVPIRQIKNLTIGKLFSLPNLKVIGEFEAQPNDAWLLDVTQIHSVIASSTSISRIAICLQSSRHSAAHVKEMLTETGYL